MVQTIIHIGLVLLGIWFVANRFLPIKGVQIISVSQLKQELRKKDVHYIDVRTPIEFHTNHIPGFKNIPLSRFQSEFMNYQKIKKLL
jgi:3-mercaptopyruvate sulfurtransferase SseA